jgi:hypothetical protein
MSRVWAKIRALHADQESQPVSRAQGSGMIGDPAGSDEISVAAGAPIGIGRRRNGNDDDAEREHGQSHKFEYKCVHDKIPPSVPGSLSRSH